MASAQRCCALHRGHACLLQEVTRDSHRQHTGAAYGVAVDADVSDPDLPSQSRLPTCAASAAVPVGPLGLEEPLSVRSLLISIAMLI